MPKISKLSFFEYDLKPNKEVTVGEFHNGKFEEQMFNFDTLVLVSPKITLNLDSKTTIFNKFEAVKCGDFMIKIKE